MTSCQPLHNTSGLKKWQTKVYDQHFCTRRLSRPIPNDRNSIKKKSKPNWCLTNRDRGFLYTDCIVANTVCFFRENGIFNKNTFRRMFKFPSLPLLEVTKPQYTGLFKQVYIVLVQCLLVTEVYTLVHYSSKAPYNIDNIDRIYSVTLAVRKTK